MTEKKTWKDSFYFVTRAPEGKPRFDALVPGYKHVESMGPAMAYMYRAYDPISDKYFRVTFATAAGMPQKEADKLGKRMMARKIREYYQDRLNKLLEVVL